jgi:hypothetical protein
MGGIHPYDGKDISKDKEIVDYLPQGECVYPLSQHIGAPAVPLVKKGDYVLVGQKIAEAGGFVSANIHSGVSGTVKAVEPRMTVSGNKVNSIIIDNDHNFTEVDFSANIKPLESLYREDVKEALTFYLVQLAFNFFWTIIFFNLEWYLFAFFWLIVLWGLILITILKFNKISRAAAYLMIPYLVWVTFAGYLNLGIYLRLK